MNLSKLRQQQFYYPWHFIIKIIILRTTSCTRATSSISVGLLELYFGLWVEWAKSSSSSSFVRFICSAVSRIVKAKRTNRTHKDEKNVGDSIQTQEIFAFYLHIFSFVFRMPVEKKTDAIHEKWILNLCIRCTFLISKNASGRHCAVCIIAFVVSGWVWFVLFFLFFWLNFN